MAFVALIASITSTSAHTQNVPGCKSKLCILPRKNDLVKFRQRGRLEMSARSSTSQQGGTERRAILLVDHGSKRMESNNMLNEIQELVVERLGSTPTVHIAHMELASPTIHEGFARCVADGANHIVVIPFFLGPGRHVTTDIPKLAAAAVRSFPGLTHEVCPHLGVHPALVDVILERGGITKEENVA